MQYPIELLFVYLFFSKQKKSAFAMKTVLDRASVKLSIVVLLIAKVVEQLDLVVGFHSFSTAIIP